MADDRAHLRTLRRDYGQWLGGSTFAWSHFATLTFSKPPGPRAIRHFGLFVQDLAEELQREPIVAFCAMEVGPEGARHHLHALLELPGVGSEFISAEWLGRFGFARVGPYNPQLGGLHYVTKYVIKDACHTADWRLYPTQANGPGDDLFRAASRRTGYQLYTRYMQELASSDAEKGG